MKKRAGKGVVVFATAVVVACLAGAPCRAMGQDLNADLSLLQRKDNIYSVEGKAYGLFDTFADNDEAVKASVRALFTIELGGRK